MKNLITQLPRKWLIVICSILIILITSGIAYGANQIIVHFDGGVDVSGKITIIAPDPDLTDLVIISTPDFTFTTGNTDVLTGVIVVQNNSAWDLTLTIATFTIDSTKRTGSFGFNPANTPVLNAHSQHSIPVFFNPHASPAAGEFSYSGNLTYSW